MLCNTRFYVSKKYEYTFNDKLLYDFYAPILQGETINFYINLLHEADKQTQTMGIATDINEYFQLTGTTLIEFSKVRSKLEAMGLLTTYLQSNPANGLSTYTFILNEPLSFQDFIANQKYRHLLIKNIGQTNYEKLEYIYLSSRIPRDAINVSTTFDNVFNDEEIQSITNVNFQNLYTKIASATSLPIVIEQTSKDVIESYFKSYDLSSKEIESCVLNSINITDDHVYHVDIDLLKLNFNKLVNSINNLNVLKNIQLNRNAKIFMKHSSQNELSSVFNDYNSLNSEQYLRAIDKTNLTAEHLTTIKVLREKYLLPDYVINLLIDYTLFKTNGTLNDKYINKVAQTVNALNLKTLSEIYDHFHFINKVNQTFSNNIVTHQEEIE
jgi:replication initiation and membrane attachment protein